MMLKPPDFLNTIRYISQNQHLHSQPKIHVKHIRTGQLDKFNTAYLLFI